MTREELIQVIHRSSDKAVCPSQDCHNYRAKGFHNKEEIYYANIDDVHCYWWISGEEIIQVRLSNSELGVCW